MSKPKYIQFEDGRQAVVFTESQVVRNLHPEYLFNLTSGLFQEPILIPETKEVILIKKGKV